MEESGQNERKFHYWIQCTDLKLRAPGVRANIVLWRTARLKIFGRIEMEQWRVADTRSL